MILYLLFPLLIMGVQESQTANMTEGEFGTSTMAPDNVTSSSGNQTGRIGDGQTSPTIMMDTNEDFQNQNNPPGHCQLDILTNWSRICEEQFDEEMQIISSEDRCHLESFTKPYSDMTHCLELLSGAFGCFYPNPSTQDFFLRIHSYYFQNCTKEELRLQDAPHGVVIALTLLPVSLIPILVHLVVWKSKVQE